MRQIHTFIDHGDDDRRTARGAVPCFRGVDIGVIRRPRPILLVVIQMPLAGIISIVRARHRSDILPRLSFRRIDLHDADKIRCGMKRDPTLLIQVRHCKHIHPGGNTQQKGIVLSQDRVNQFDTVKGIDCIDIIHAEIRREGGDKFIRKSHFGIWGLEDWIHLREVFFISAQRLDSFQKRLFRNIRLQRQQGDIAKKDRPCLIQ